MKRFIASKQFRFAASLFLCLLVLGSNALLAQKSSKQLKEDRRKLEKEIRLYSKLVEDARKVRSESMNELQLLTKQVFLREQLLASLNAEVKQLGVEIEETQLIITSLEEDVEKIKTEFAKIMVYVYKNMPRRSSSFLFLSSKSISDGVARIRFFKEIERKQKSQMKLIKRTAVVLDKKRQELETKKTEKVELRQKEQVQKKELDAIRTKQKDLYERLRTEEDNFRNILKKKNNALISLNKAIEKAIAAEIAEPKNPKSAEAEEIPILTSNFEKNKGKLPWPLPSHNGTITQRFGMQKLEGSAVERFYPDIHITTTKDQSIRSVFDGSVASVMQVPLYGKMVIIRHGNYYSVYANLDEPTVKAGDEVTTLQSIGTARTDANTGETKVLFRLYKQKEALNPEKWIMKKK